MRTILAFLAASAAIAASPVRAQVVNSEVPEEARGLDIVEKLGERVPLDAELTTVEGETVRLGDFFDSRDAPERGKPTLLLMVYYDCPIACPALLNNLNRAFNGLDDWTIGDEFNVLAVSFDPTNTQAQASQYATLYRSGYEQNADNPETVAEGYRFLRASGDTSRAIADSVGFGFRYLPEVNEYAHATGVVVLAPDGTVSRYFYGFGYEPRQVRLALLDAADGRIGASFGDRVLLFCFSYDPNRNSYALAATRVMQIGAAISIVLVGGLVAVLKLGERVVKARDARADSERGPAAGAVRAVGVNA